MAVRAQLNLRMDDQCELLAAVKARAKEERITVKDFVVKALKDALHVPSTSQSSQPSLSELHDLKERINGVQIGLMGELRKRDAQLKEQQFLIAELASAVARLEARLDGIPPSRKRGKTSLTSQTRKKGATEIQTPPPSPLITPRPPDYTDEEIEKLSPSKQWEVVCTDMIDNLNWEEV